VFKQQKKNTKRKDKNEESECIKQIDFNRPSDVKIKITLCLTLTTENIYTFLLALNSNKSFSFYHYSLKSAREVETSNEINFYFIWKTAIFSLNKFSK
jgi:hypothetical protein